MKHKATLPPSGIDGAIDVQAMKYKGFALWTALSVVLVATTFAAEINARDDSATASATGRNTNPVSELRNDDSAFSLLIEAYRQFQNHLIQMDYNARLHAASLLTDIKVRRQVTVLAKQERELRIRKLYGQVDNLSTTYDLNRQRLEREAGVEAPSTVDTTAAAEKLRNFVVLTPATESASDIGSIKTIPARTVLLDTRPAP
jgi:hypothetical protein